MFLFVVMLSIFGRKGGINEGTFERSSKELQSDLRFLFTVFSVLEASSILLERISSTEIQRFLER